CGWPDHVQRQILTRATSLMPRSLRHLLARHRRNLVTGAREAGSGTTLKGAGEQQGPMEAAGAAAGLQESLTRITALVNGHARLAQVAREMGRAAHLVAVLSNPLCTVPSDPQAALYAPRFGTYMADGLDRFRIVFEGYRDPFLTRKDVLAFGRRLADRSRSYVDDLVGAYVRFDVEPDPALFDERSVVFGIASLSFSRSVNDTARVWLHDWEQAHGDLSGLPLPLDRESDSRAGPIHGDAP
ncbi:MAG: hypothetical protein ACE5ID_10115, partial [Acidobacteriota bacterium]